MKEIHPDEIANLIRAKSAEGELTTSADIEAEFADTSEGELEPMEDHIHDALLRHDDIRAISCDSGNRFYYSERSMTGTYANVLALKAQGPLLMMAEVIRENSRVYPRPVPVSLFQCSPFSLNEDRIVPTLDEMKQSASYRDIEQVTTSAGNVFACSTDYLNRDHAAMLAEWADVGQAENP